MPPWVQLAALISLAKIMDTFHNTFSNCITPMVKTAACSVYMGNKSASPPPESPLSHREEQNLGEICSLVRGVNDVQMVFP